MKHNWYQDDYVGGYFADDGHFVVCEEYCTDRDCDRYSVEVQNGQGYYDDDGIYRNYEDD